MQYQYPIIDWAVMHVWARPRERTQARADFPSGHVWMWELDYIKKAEHRRIDAFELWCWRRLLRVPRNCKEIQPVHPKGDQSWVFIGRTDVEAETPILWPSDVESWLIWKDPDAGKDWGQKEKGTTEDELDGITNTTDIGLGTPGVGDGQGGLVCYGSWGRKESDMTERLNWAELNHSLSSLLLSGTSLESRFLLNVFCPSSITSQNLCTFYWRMVFGKI